MNTVSTIDERKKMLVKDLRGLSLRRQCELLDLARSTAYYRVRFNEDRWLKTVELMNRIDEVYTEHPHLGRYGITNLLAERYGLTVNHKCVRRLMRKMGLEAVYPKPRRNTSLPVRGHEKYPYLLRNLDISRVDQVWCADITYIRLVHGFIYLVAVMDWYSRAVLSWKLSTTLDSTFCVEALKEALDTGRKPEIFNTDQGSQFTSEAFTMVLIDSGISISMDGKGRAFDNIMVERLWRTVKYESVYLEGYETVPEARRGLARYFDFYNHERRHSSLGKCTPASFYGLATHFDTGCKLDKTRRFSSLGRAVSPVALRAPSETALDANVVGRLHLNVH